MQLNAFALVIFSTVPYCHVRSSFLVSIIRSKVCTKFFHPFPLVWNRSSPVTPCVFRFLFQLFQTFGTPQSYIGVYVFLYIYIQCYKSLEQLEQERVSPCHHWPKAVPDFTKNMEKSGQTLEQITSYLNLSPYIATLGIHYHLALPCVSSFLSHVLPAAYSIKSY